MDKKIITRIMFTGERKGLVMRLGRGTGLSLNSEMMERLTINVSAIATLMMIKK